MPIRFEWTEASPLLGNVYAIEWWDCPRCDFKREIAFNHLVQPMAMENVQLHVYDHTIEGTRHQLGSIARGAREP